MSKRGAMPGGHETASTQRVERQSGGDWRSKGNCVGKDPEMFFPGSDIEVIDKAKEICNPCNVRERCLEFALSTNQVYGVWGGLSKEERGTLRRALRRRRAQHNRSNAS